MDGDGVRMATRMRALAMEKYPDEADAVINVQTDQNSVGTIVTVTGEVVELKQGQTVGVRDAQGARRHQSRRGGSGGRNARRRGRAGLSPRGGTAGMMGGGAAGVGSVGTYLGVKQHRRRSASRSSSRPARPAANRIAHLLAKRSSLQKCAADEIPYANCKVNDTIAGASDPAKPRGRSLL